VIASDFVVGNCDALIEETGNGRRHAMRIFSRKVVLLESGF
jgi:hypothetical protein